MDANRSSISLSDEQQQKQSIGNEEFSFPDAAAISPSLAAMALNDQISQQQQQSASRQAPVSLSTPEAYWSASSNLSSAPELTVSSSEALDNGSLFESINRPYTPSYNSTSGLEGALSDQEDYWSGAGSHFEGVDFDFGQELYKGQPNSFSSAYDPETADSYNNLESALLVAHSFSNPNHSSINNNNSSGSSSATSSALSTQQALQQTHLSNDLTPGSTAPTRIPVVSFADQNAFRDPVEKSPIASPLLGATSPHHTRHSSFGSNIGSPTPALDQKQTWMQSLGQRMNLGADDVSQYSRQQYSSNTDNNRPSQPTYPWQQQQQHGTFVPVFEEEGADVGSQQQQQSQQSGDRAYPSYTYSQQQPESLFEQRRPNEEMSQLPLLSINDTTMQEASFVMGAKAEPKGWQNATGSEWSQVQGNYYPLSLPDNTAPQSGWSQTGHAQAPAPSSSRPPNEAITNQPKRQDSYDPIRKFLRLDVDMGFVSQQQQQQQQQQYQGGGDVGRWNAIRKRSNSDFGPSYFGLKDGDAAASPPLFTIVPGGVTDKTPTAMTSGVDWVTEAARQRKLQAQAQAQAHGGSPSNSSIVMAMQQNNGHTMDPLLLQNYHYQSQQHPQQHPQSRYDPASGPMRQRDTSNVRGAAVPYASHNRTSSSSGTNNMTPWAPVSPTLRPSNPPSASPVYRPSNLARSNSASRHRRGAQSEDLSQLARSSNPSEFLNRITAPDGSLAPPNARTQHFSSLAGPAPYGGSGSPAGMAGSSRLNPYRTSHDRHHSASSNHSNASSPGSNDAHDGAYSSMRTTPAAGSMNPPPGPPKVGRSRLYSQTALPTYTSLGSPAGDQAMQAAGAADVATGTFSVPVVQVTTSATQAASASRRKNEAIHICPIPGCGSTFTRKFNLNGHIRSHTGARPYECREPGCGKSFARSFDLSRHEKLHAGIKPHNCESCGKAFARADALSRHLRNDAGNGGCAARISEEDEEGLTPGSPPAGPRMRNGSSASSSLDSSDELDRQRQERLRDLQDTNEETDRQASHVKRESRFKGYIL